MISNFEISKIQKRSDIMLKTLLYFSLIDVSTLLVSDRHFIFISNVGEELKKPLLSKF